MQKKFESSKQFFKVKDKIRTNARRKYKTDETCCAYCQTWDHHKCRPKLNGTLCSCTCPVATEMREHHAYKTAQAIKEGKPAPNIIETLKELRPGKVWIKYTQEAFNKIDENK